jgi:hypothetical protein
MDLGYIYRWSRNTIFVNISNSFILAGLIPFVLLMFLNLRILISLSKLRSRLGSKFSGNNPDKGEMK